MRVKDLLCPPQVRFPDLLSHVQPGGVIQGKDSRAKEVADTGNMRMFTYNARSFSGAKWGEVLQKLVGESYDVASIQETWWTKARAREAARWFRGNGFIVYWAVDESAPVRGRGVATIIRPWLVGHVASYTTWRGCLLKLEFAFQGRQTLTHLNLYVPDVCSERAAVTHQFLTMVRPLAEKKRAWVACGDFNAAMSPRLDSRSGGQMKKGSMRTGCFRSMWGAHSGVRGLDVFRELHPERVAFTRVASEGTASRLDYWFVSPGMFPHVRWCDIGEGSLSDHEMVSMQVRGFLRVAETGLEGVRRPKNLVVDRRKMTAERKTQFTTMLGSRLSELTPWDEDLRRRAGEDPDALAQNPSLVDQLHAKVVDTVSQVNALVRDCAEIAFGVTPTGRGSSHRRLPQLLSDLISATATCKGVLDRSRRISPDSDEAGRLMAKVARTTTIPVMPPERWPEWVESLQRHHQWLKSMVEHQETVWRQEELDRVERERFHRFLRHRGRFLDDLLDRHPTSLKSIWYLDQEGELDFTDNPEQVNRLVGEYVEGKWGTEGTSATPVPSSVIPLPQDVLARLMERWREAAAPPSRMEFEEGLAGARKGAGSGPSGINIDMLLLVPPAITELLFEVVRAIFLTRRPVPELTNIDIWFIPKGKGRVTRVDKMRPIALREAWFKVASAILDARVSAILVDFPLCQKSQRGFVFGGSTSGPLQTMTAVLERPRGEGDIHMGLVDITGAYDTMPYHAVQDGYRRFHASQGFLHLKQAFSQGAQCRGLTGCGVSDYVTMRRGLPQGDPCSPLDWVIGFDAALSRLEEVGEGIPFTDEDGEFRLKVIAYADDVTIYATTREELQRQFDCLAEWCEGMGMSMSLEKTEYIARVKEFGPQPFVHLRHRGGDGVYRTSLLTPLQEGESWKYLGVWFDNNLTWTEEIDRFQREAVEVCEIAADLRCANQAVYVLNAILVGRLSYALQVAKVPEGQLRAIDSRMRDTVAQVSKLGRRTNLGVFFGPSESHGGLGFGLQSLVGVVREMRPSELVLDLNSSLNPCTRVARAQVWGLQGIARAHGISSSLEIPSWLVDVELGKAAQHRLADALRWMGSTSRICYRATHMHRVELPLALVLPPEMYKRYYQQMLNVNVRDLRSLVPDGVRMISWEDLALGGDTLLVGRPPAWFQAVTAFLCGRSRPMVKVNIRQLLMKPSTLFPSERQPVYPGEVVWRGDEGGPPDVLVVDSVKYYGGEWVVKARRCRREFHAGLEAEIYRQLTHDFVFLDAGTLRTTSLLLEALPHSLRRRPERKASVEERYVLAEDIKKKTRISRGMRTARPRGELYPPHQGSLSEAPGLAAGGDYIRAGRVGEALLGGTAGRLFYFSDGSTSVGTDPKAAFALYVEEGHGISRVGIVPGKQTNNKAEAWGVLAALQEAPRNRDLRLVVDSSYVLLKWNRWVARRRPPTDRQRCRMANRSLWKAIRSAYWKRVEAGGRCIIEKCVSHSKETPQGNSFADRLAKLARTNLQAEGRHDVWEGWMENEERVLAFVEGAFVEGDFRCQVRKAIQGEYHRRWEGCTGQGWFWREKGWSRPLAAKMLQGRNGWLKSRFLQFLIGEAAVGVNLKRWKFSSSEACPLCRTERETTYHALVCPATDQIRARKREWLDRKFLELCEKSPQSPLVNDVWVAAGMGVTTQFGAFGLPPTLLDVAAEGLQEGDQNSAVLAA
eukprot:Lithocolla_globosa_v1_NODE_88_length_6608_cov_12.657409.p1 type:complete len:1701 gc:universal NODE_88_length_6608_cov_12.657409:5282-180(-)